LLLLVSCEPCALDTGAETPDCVTRMVDYGADGIIEYRTSSGDDIEGYLRRVESDQDADGHTDFLWVPLSCMTSGLCASCGARRMASRAAWLVDRVIPEVPVRQ